MNWQNLPKEVKKLFGPNRGNVLVQADFSNVEMRVQYVCTGDDVLEEIFKSGKKVHDENTKVMFGVLPDATNFDVCKKAAKTYIFGRGYGGGLRGIYERVVMQVPELGLTFEKFVAVDEAYRNAHPKYFAWHDKIIACALDTGEVHNGFGRVRKLSGSDGAVSRQALNTPIQGTAADIFNIALITLSEQLSDLRLGKLVGAVHDSIIVECKKEDAMTVAVLMKQCMEQPHQLWGRTVSFPVDVELCEHNWGEAVKLDMKGAKDGMQDRRADGTTSDEREWVWGEEDDDEETVKPTGQYSKRPLAG